MIAGRRLSFLGLANGVIPSFGIDGSGLEGKTILDAVMLSLVNTAQGMKPG